MFKLAEKREVLWPVVISVPQDKGTAKEVEIDIRYKLLTKSERAAMDKLSEEERNTKALEYITGWGRVEDADGNPVEFSRENLEALMEYDFIAIPIAQGWRQVNRGAAVKNS